MAKKKSKPRTNKKKNRNLFPGIIFRLAILAVVMAGILAIGHYKFGWQVLGDKTSRLDKKKTPATKTLPKDQTDELEKKIKDAVNKIKQEMSKAIPEKKDEKEATPEPTTEAKTDENKTDSDKLKDFLESELK